MLIPDVRSEFHQRVAVVTGAGQARWGSDAARARVQGGVPANRFASPQEIAESASFLMSDRADDVTGEVLVVDGGQWLGKSVYTDERSNHG